MLFLGLSLRISALGASIVSSSTDLAVGEPHRCPLCEKLRWQRCSRMPNPVQERTSTTRIRGMEPACLAPTCVSSVVAATLQPAAAATTCHRHSRQDLGRELGGLVAGKWIHGGGGSMDPAGFPTVATVMSHDVEGGHRAGALPRIGHPSPRLAIHP